MRTSLIALLVAAAAFVLADRAYGLGADYSKEQIAEHGPHAVHGYFINEFDTVFFEGDAEAFNKFLAKTTEGRDRKPTVVLRPGVLRAKSPWDKTGEGVEADWSFHFSANGETVPQVEVWVGERIDREKLKFPKGVRVTGFDE